MPSVTRSVCVVAEVREGKLSDIAAVIAVVEDSVEVKVVYLVSIEVIALVC